MREKALEIATAAHKGQKRKFSGEPYISHPKAVAEIALSKLNMNFDSLYSGDLADLVYCVAILHDVVEDTDVTLKDLEREFSEDIIHSVGVLTKSGNYKESIDRISKSHYVPILVKISDLEHNMSDLEEGTLKDKYRLAHWILTKELNYLESYFFSSGHVV